MSDPRPILFGEPCFDEREVLAAAEVIRSRWIGQGRLVEEFEARLASYVRAEHAVAVSSCTAALELALRAAGIGPGDEVITTPMTFVATVNAIDEVGATPALVDIDPQTLLLTPGAVEGALGPRTRAILPVSFGGRPLDIKGFLDLAEARDLWVIEDAAHSIGGIAGGLPIGATRHDRLMTCFSFYPNKNLASAEGGAITTRSDAIATSLRSMRLHGLGVDAWERYKAHTFSLSLAQQYGAKCNWTDLQAAIALVQLDKLEGFLATREYLANEYDERLEQCGQVRLLKRAPVSISERHALHLYQIRTDAERRNGLIQALREQAIGATLHYVGVNQHPHFRGRFPRPLPHSDLASTELVTLPLHPSMSLVDLGRVTEAIRSAEFVAAP